MLEKQYMLIVFASIFLISYAHAFTFDARTYRFDEAVSAVYEYVQAHSDLVHLSEELLALYAQFQQGNYEISDTQYMKVCWEVSACKQLIARDANVQSMCQEFIDLHS